MKKILIAFQFLTIIPIRRNISISETDIAKSTSAFVIVGLFQGILLIATDYISGRVFHPDLVIAIILFVLVLSNGGLHLDGLADTFDAIAAKSEGDTEIDREKRLKIMKDSSTGAVGVIAIVSVLALKYLALKNLSHFSFFTYYFSLILMPVLSKWAMIIAMFHGRPARAKGLGKVFVERVGLKETALSTLILLLLLSFPQAFFSHYIPSNQYIFYGVLLLLIYLFSRLWVNFCHKRFGGLTGDTLGAISETIEVIFLLMVIAWSQLFT